MRRLWLLVLALALAACGPEPVPARPALWQVEGPRGQQAWLFGTIHSFDRPVLWRTAAVDRALNSADLLMVEVADLDDQAALTSVFAKLARTTGQPPLSARVEPRLRDELAELLDEHGLNDDQFGHIETWAVALTLAQAESGALESKYGVDRAVIEAARGMPVTELEGAAGQLALFDSLPEAEQRDLLEAIIADSHSLESESDALTEAWRKGDMAVIERETGRGLLADPELRAILFTQRNRSWSERIARELSNGVRPFVAVGAAHMAGPEGLPALLSDMGYTVTRIQ